MSMGTKVVLLTVILTLTGCKLENKMGASSWSSADFIVMCLDGVQYYGRAAGNKSYMAPRFDKDTKQVALCNI